MSVVHIHVGGAGLRIAQSVWDCVCCEQGVAVETGKAGADPSDFFFQEQRSGVWKARAVLADLDPEPMGELKHMGVFEESRKVWTYEGGGFSSRGKYTIGKELIGEILDGIESAVEECERCAGLVLYCSQLGGTGSGLSDLLCERLSVQYDKTTLAKVVVFPSSTCNEVTQAYNFVLSDRMLIESDLNIAVNNDALYQLTPDVDWAHFNEPVAQLAALMHSPLTHASWHRYDLQMLQAALVQHPRVNTVIPSLFPMRDVGAGETKALFAVPNATETKTYQSMLIVNSAQELSAWDIEERLSSSPQCFDVASRSRPEWRDWQATDSSHLLLANSDLVVQCYKRVAEQWDRMYAKRAFVHWYVGEGLESGEMSEVRENLAALVNDYEQLTHPRTSEEE